MLRVKYKERFTRDDLQAKKLKIKLWRILESYGALQIFKGKGKYMRKVQNEMFKELYELIRWKEDTQNILKDLY